MVLLMVHENVLWLSAIYIASSKLYFATQHLSANQADLRKERGVSRLNLAKRDVHEANRSADM